MELLALIKSWLPSLVSVAAAIAINRALKKQDDRDAKIEDHEKRLVRVETRCEERGGC